MSGARKGSRLPALEGLGPSGSAGSILSKAMPSQLLESLNQTNKQANLPMPLERQHRPVRGTTYQPFTDCLLLKSSLNLSSIGP